MKVFNWKVALLALTSIYISSCVRYKTMTTVPERYVVNPIWLEGNVEINFAMVQSMSTFHDEIKKLESQSFEVQKDESIEPIEFGVKTSNPLYNPNKWMYTKNPFYHPNKWIKIWTPFGTIKEKDPLYNPVKEIKTKNLAYSPNKYTTIETKMATVQGYKLSAKVNGKIKLTPYHGNKLNLQVPIKTSGWVSLVTGITPPLVRTPFEGKLVLDLDVSLDVNENWCIQLNPKANFKWTDRLKLDLTHGLKLLEIDVSPLANPEIDKILIDIENSITNSFDCNEFKEQAKENWKTKKIHLDDSYYAIATPNKMSLSRISIDEKVMKIFGGIQCFIKITSDITNIREAGEFPELVIVPPANPSIDLALPINISYQHLDNELMKQTVGLKIGDSDAPINGDLIIRKIETFPSGRDLGIKIKFKTDLNKKILNTNATAYFNGKISHRILSLSNEPKEHVISYRLDTLGFNDFGNGKDKGILSIVYESLKEEIEKIEDFNITDHIKDAEDILIQTIPELLVHLPQDDQEQAEVSKPEVRIKDWAYSEKHLMMLLRAQIQLK